LADAQLGGGAVDGVVLAAQLERRCIMRTLADATAIADAVKETIEQSRRVVARGRETAEDGIAAAVHQVRRHPVRVVAAATAIGALAGCVIGFAWGRCARR
jgi:hypothetical protein